MALLGSPFFGNLPGTDTAKQTLANMPGASDSEHELREHDSDYVLTVELPGFSEDDITVTWNDGDLTVAAEQHTDTDSTKRRRGYHRTYTFPQRVDDDGIEAEYNNGVLEITLPVEGTHTPEGKEIAIN